MKHLKTKRKTLTVFFIINILTSIVGLAITRLSLGPINVVQGVNIVISLFFISSVKKITSSKRYLLGMFFYYLCIVLVGMWIGLTVSHPLFLGYAIMLFQVMIITLPSRFHNGLIISYLAILCVLGYVDMGVRDVSFISVRDLNIERFISVISIYVGNLIILKYNVSENEELTTDIVKESYTDELTQSKNRKAFFDEIEAYEHAYLMKHRNYRLVFVDVDGLKMINDSYGHEYGDKAIVRVSSFIQTNIRDNDCIYRLGGDEFVICFQDIDEANLDKKMSYLRKNINRSANLPFVLSFSYGYASRDQHQSIDDTMKSADHSMYQMKFSSNKSLATV